MSGWSRTVRPVADKTLANTALLPDSNPQANANVLFPNIYGVDLTEIAARPEIAQVGWVYRRQIGSRVQWETIVAMKEPPVEENDDAVLANVAIAILTQPSTITVSNANAAASFTVSATATPSTYTLQYRWQVSANGGVTYANVNNTGVYTGNANATLNLANTVGLTGNLYRVVVSNTSTGVSVTSDAANITV